MMYHISKYKWWKSKRTKQYCSSFILFENYGIDNCKMVLLENVSCTNRKELSIREEFHRQKNIEICVNKKACYQTRMGARKKTYEWREKNKEKVKISLNKIRKKNTKRYICECGLSLQLGSKQNHLKTKRHQKYLLEKKYNIQQKKYNIQQKKYDIQLKKFIKDYKKYVNLRETFESEILTFSEFYFKVNSINKKKKKEKIIKQSKKRFNIQFKKLLKTYDRFVKRNEKYENVIMNLTFSQYYFRFGSWYRK